MDKRIFREYMDNELVQKTIIFANTFGLSIDRWKPAKEDSKFPYRIHLYERNNIVGYIDASVEEHRERFIFIDKYPIMLYTKIGNLEGYYHDKEFIFDIEKINSDTTTKMHGLFSIQRGLRNSNYNIKSYVFFQDNAEDSYYVSFNHCLGYGTLNISKNNGLEDLSFNVGRDLSISHETNVVRGEYEDVYDIRVTQNTPSTVLGEFKLHGMLVRQEDFTVENFNGDRKSLDTLFDLEKLNTEITDYDPRIFELIEEVRELLAIPTSKGTLSIYDHLAAICLSDDKNKISDSLIKDKRISEKLKKNPVLQKMNHYNKRHF